ncbi:MAG: T9SS type A sorting domain-containing protein [Candidatus Sabulitectum sp.]|nr:T9SS type A sorting domain-containing protein [Candidatus Sabulitectum sp.]
MSSSKIASFPMITTSLWLRYGFMLLVLPTVTLSAGEIILSIPVEPSSICISDAGLYSRVTGRVMGRINTQGVPDLPAYTDIIALPTGCLATNMEVVNCRYESVRSYCKVMPIPPDIPISMLDSFLMPVEPDPTIYESGSFFPELPVEFTGSSVIMGIPVAYIRVFPARWNPASGALELLSDLTIQVTYESNSQACMVSRRTLQSELRAQETVRKAVINPLEVCASGAIIVDHKDLTYGEYVIITLPAYEEYAQELADWKTSKGIPASVYTTSWIQDHYTFFDLQQNIRAFLTDCREDGTEYVLIYGDDNRIRGRDVELSAGPWLEYPPIDLYWSDINDLVPGDDLWDSNGNHVWGEYGCDDVDYHPDLWTGRASVNSLGECSAFNEKVFVYEGILSRDYSYSSEIEERIGYTTASLGGGNWGAESAENISELVPYGWDEEKCYEQYGNNSIAITDSMLNAGPHHVYCCCHGAPELILVPDGYYTTEHVRNLTNITSGGLPAIWNSPSCNIGWMDQHECLGDAWNGSPGGGGFGAFNARYGLSTSFLLSEGFYDVMWIDDHYNLGIVHMMTKEELYPPFDGYDDWCIKEYNLFGDPELPMWFSAPAELSVEHVDSISSTTEITVSVHSGSMPLQGARVCLQKGPWQTGDIYLVETTNSAGQCTFYLSPCSTGTISVVAWARNHLCYQGSIEVTSNGLDEVGVYPNENQLKTCQPNPSNRSITIPIILARENRVRVDVYDLSGRLVKNIANEEMSGGAHSFLWILTDSRGNEVPSGIYQVRVCTSNWSESSSVVVIR